MSDDFCPTHGYEHMVSQFGSPVPYCKACEEAPSAWRYQRKIGWGDIWRTTTEDPSQEGFFETPGDWRVEPVS
jgi:hypothetical protein